MWNLKKMIQINLLTKQKDSQIQKTNSWLPKGKGQGGEKRGDVEFRINKYILLYKNR